MREGKLSDELVQLSARQLAALISKREVSPVEVLEAHLRRIERVNPKLNAIVTLAPDSIERALEAEAAMMRGEAIGPLHGVPVTVKDTIETKGLLATSGSRLRASYVPQEDAPAVARLKSAGAIVLGKTNVSEMAIPYECDNPVFGRTNNPFDLKRTSGGSSGGEAAAISASLSPLGLGSDLSGSIRVPAHFCGIVGLRPTAALVPAAGHFPQTSGAFALGAVMGPMARRIEDLSLMLDVLAGAQTSATAESGLSRNMRGERVAVFVDEQHAPLTNETRETLNQASHLLAEAGLVIVEEKPPGLEQAINLWPKLFSQESLNQLCQAYAGKESVAGPVVSAVLASAERRPSALDEFATGKAKRDALRSRLAAWMETTPFIIAPVGSTPAFEHGARAVDVEGEAISVFRAFGYSRLANVLDLPSVSVPVARTSEGLPIGIQIIGRPFEEKAVLGLALILEETFGNLQPPQI